jgi:prepilin-type N-terminal cleavage/methylation domain-containing protein
LAARSEGSGDPPQADRSKSKTIAPDLRNKTKQIGGFTLVELLVVIAIIGILIALLLPAIQAAREAARRSQCQNNLRNVALAMANYESAKKSYPIGTALDPAFKIETNMSFRENWAISILPYLEQQALYDGFDLTKPILDPINRIARGTNLPVMLCASDMNNGTFFDGLASRQGDNWARGNYAANGGNGAYLKDYNAYYIDGPDSPGWLHSWTRGVVGPNCTSRVQQITDGLSNTVLIGEIRAGIHEGDPRGLWAYGHVGGNIVAWMGSMGDDNGPNVCTPRGDDIFSATLECEGKDLAEMQAQCMSCFSGGRMNQATLRSSHPNGVYVAMCDASVRWVDDSIETSGVNGACCTAWDHLFGSQDGGTPGNR